MNNRSLSPPLCAFFAFVVNFLSPYTYSIFDILLYTWYYIL
jgi:hypothetical protein